MLSFKKSRDFLLVGLQSFLLVTLLAIYVSALGNLAQRPAATAYAKFYFAAHQALVNQSLYAPMDPNLFGAPSTTFDAALAVTEPPLHMPQVTLSMMPLALLAYPASSWLWSALALAAGLLACAISWRVLRSPATTNRELVWMWIALLGFIPTFFAILGGQAVFLLFLLLMLGWRAARTGHDRAAGILIGLAISLRVFSGLLLFYFLVKRRWTLSLWCAASLTVTILIGLAVAGPGAYAEWWRATRSITWYGRNWNASFAGFFTRIWGGTDNISSFNRPDIAWTLTMLCSLACVALLVWLAWPRRTPVHQTELDDLTFGLTTALMLLISPLGWMYYFPILFVGGFAAWKYTGSRLSHTYRWGLGLAWLLSMVPSLPKLAEDLNDPIGWLTWDSVYFYALLVFSATLALMAKRLRAMDPPDATEGAEGA